MVGGEAGTDSSLVMKWRSHEGLRMWRRWRSWNPAGGGDWGKGKTWPTPSQLVRGKTKAGPRHAGTVGAARLVWRKEDPEAQGQDTEAECQEGSLWGSRMWNALTRLTAVVPRLQRLGIHRPLKSFPS